jgi:hypothetical protein
LEKQDKHPRKMIQSSWSKTMAPTTRPGHDKNLTTTSTLGRFSAPSMPSLHAPWRSDSSILGGGAMFYLCGNMDVSGRLLNLDIWPYHGSTQQLRFVLQPDWRTVCCLLHNSTTTFFCCILGVSWLTQLVCTSHLPHP